MGGFAIMPFEGYDKTVREKLGEEYKTEDGTMQLKYPETTKKDLKAVMLLIQEGARKGFSGKKDTTAAMPPRTNPSPTELQPQGSQVCQTRDWLPPAAHACERLCQTPGPARRD